MGIIADPTSYSRAEWIELRKSSETCELWYATQGFVDVFVVNPIKPLYKLAL